MRATSIITRPTVRPPAATRARRPAPSESWLAFVVLALVVVGGVVGGTQHLHAFGAMRPGGVNVEPSARPWRYVGANPGSWWCVQPNCVADPTATMNRELNVAHQLGAANVRLEFPWFLIEPQNGVYDWSRSDQIMSAALAAHVTIQPVVAFTPSWAGSNTTTAPQGSDFAAFVTAFTKRYDRQFSVIEMWNEADHGHYWNSGEQAYVSSVLNPGYAAVKSVDPMIRVEVSGTANDPTTDGWLSTLYSLGAQYDIMAFHNYVGNPLAEAQAIHSAMAAHGDSRPIWLGEYGVASATGDQSALINATLTGAGPLAMAQWYNLRDDAAYTCCPPVAAVTASWGLLNFDYSLKPGYRTMQSLLGGSVPRGLPAVTQGPAPLSSPSLSPLPPNPSGSPSPGPRRASGGLHVSGNHIVDATGAAVPLHGVDLSGTEFVCAQGWSADPFGGQPEDSPRTIAAMQSWHVDVVRIPLNEDCWLGINGARIGGGAYQSAIVKLVHDYRAAGFYVIVDLHWSAPGKQLALSQNPAPDEDHSPAFWKSVAATFSSDLGVIYDLYNEPFFYWIASGGPDEWTCLMNGCVLNQFETGGSPFTVTANWRSAGMNELIGDVRATGAKNVIMVSGTNWARNLSGWLAHRPADNNVAASWHSYPSANPSLASECAAAWCWDSVIAPLAQKVPVIVGETGDSTAGPASYLPSFLPWASAHGLNVVAWTWNAWQYPNDIVVTDMQTGAPTVGEGVVFKAWLAHQPAVVASQPPAPGPSPSSSPFGSLSGAAVTNPASQNQAGTLFSDSFAQDAVGVAPAGWTGSGMNSSWTVQPSNGGAVQHSGWTGYLMAGSATWSNYAVSVSIRPSVWASEHDGVLLAVTEGSHYSLDIVGGDELVLTRYSNGSSSILATTPFSFNQYSWYTLTVQMTGGVLTVLVNAAPVMQVSDSALASGAIGLEANDLVAFDSVLVMQLTGATPPPISPSPAPSPR